LIEYVSNALSYHYGEEFTVSRRLILDDINFLKSERSFQAPVVSCKDGKRVYYKYDDPAYSIYRQILTSEEKDKLRQTLELLSQVKGLPSMDWLGSLQTKIFSSLDQVHPQHILISFEENEFLAGLEYVLPLYNYILNKTCLSITYKPFNAKAVQELTVSPAFLKQYNNRWFLFALNHERNGLQNLALDRILSITASHGQYRESGTRFEDYFEDIVGVTSLAGIDPQEITIRLSDAIQPYIRSKPLHGSQTVKGNVLTLKIKPNYELESLLLSFGEQITILSPESFRQKIAQRIKAANSLYECSSAAHVG
jgi:predicted DNA-binding transcriptional regulator YafY